MRNLPADLYVSDAVFLDERDKLFARTWQMLGPADQVAHDCARPIAQRYKDEPVNEARPEGHQLARLEGTGKCQDRGDPQNGRPGALR